MNPIFVQGIGYLAMLLIITAFLPQALQTIRTKRTQDISFTTFLLLVCGGTAWLVYGMLIGDLPIILTNAVIVCLQCVILGYKVKYG